MITIMIDNRKMVLQEQTELLRKNTHFDVITSFSNPIKALEQIKCIQPDLCCLDVFMPFIDGISLAQKIKQVSTHTKIIFITNIDFDWIPLDNLDVLGVIRKPLNSSKVDQILSWYQLKTETTSLDNYAATSS